MLINSIDDCGIRQFVEKNIRMYGVHNTKEVLMSVVDQYNHKNEMGMRAQKDGLDDLSFVLVLIFNWTLNKRNLQEIVDLIVDMVAKDMDKVKVEEVCEPAEVIEEDDAPACDGCKYVWDDSAEGANACNTCDLDCSNWEPEDKTVEEVESDAKFCNDCRHYLQQTDESIDACDTCDGPGRNWEAKDCPTCKHFLCEKAMKDTLCAGCRPFHKNWKSKGTK
jgi:hypothetical protein